MRQVRLDSAPRGEPCMTLPMNFRMVWMGPEDDPRPESLGRNTSAIARSSKALPPYAERGGEIVRQERLRNGYLKITTLANFRARIVKDMLLDDGEQHHREFEIEVELGGLKLAVTVTAAEFNRMTWVLKMLGPEAIIYPGQQQHARAAIQCLSTNIRQERVFTHMGWRKHGADWVYLHAGGALGADPTASEVQVRVPIALQEYRIAEPSDPDPGVRAIRDSLRILDVAPDRITFPLLAGVYRAALGGAAFSLFLAGRSGVFKSTMAALCQQHFGAEMDAAHLPANFASTANSVEMLAFLAKDALLVVDDFAPTGLPGDRELRGIAERIFRAAGNQQGRSRMSNGQTSASSQPPRALVLATGEEVPKGLSIRSRLLIINVNPGEVDTVALTECQEAALQGQFSMAMGAFLIWMAGRYDSLRQRLRARAEELRQSFGGAAHRRLPSALAELESSLEIFLEFAEETNAVDTIEREALAQRGALALSEVLARQAKYHQAADPAQQFLSLLKTAIATGRAHVSDREGRPPEGDSTAWGWQRKSSVRWVPQGPRLGWLAGSDLYLEPTASYELAQQMAGSDRLPVSEQTLRHRLREHNLLASVDMARQVLLVRRTLEGRPRQVLHLRARDL